MARNQWGAEYPPEQRAAWGAAKDAGHLKGINALPRTVSFTAFKQQLDADLQKSIDRAAGTTKKAHKKQSTIELDVAGRCLSEAYWHDSGDGTGTLFVTFTRTGDDYVYYDVPKDVALELDGGEAFNDLIRDYYDYS